MSGSRTPRTRLWCCGAAVAALSACQLGGEALARQTASDAHVSQMDEVVVTARRYALILRPSLGCTRLVRMITYEWLVGSIHNEVPVKPVCPYDPIG